MLITSKEIFQLVKDTLFLEQELSTYCRQTKQECRFVSASTNGIEETIRYSKKNDTVTGVIVDQDKITKGEDVVVWYTKELKNSGSSPEIIQITLDKEEKYTSVYFCINLPTLLKNMEQRKIINNKFLNNCLEKIKNYVFKWKN